MLFLSSEAGGPTVVTDQTLGGPLASRGWLCFPRTNRLVAFDAKYLHGEHADLHIYWITTTGVVPGRPGHPHDKEARRLSFMVGFWSSIRAKSRGKDEPGPGQPLPSYDDSRYSWHLEMRGLQPWLRLSEPHGRQSVPPIEISRIWCPIESSSAEDGMPIEAPSYLSCFQGF